jgi:hypothetical protein
MRIKSLRRVLLSEAIPVYDLSVAQTENFKLANGPFVHNSKDISDCVAAVVEGCMTDKGINSVSSLVLPNSEPQRVPDGKLEAERPRDSWVIQDYNTARQQASKILRYSTR